MPHQGVLTILCVLLFRRDEARHFTRQKHTRQALDFNQFSLKIFLRSFRTLQDSHSSRIKPRRSCLGGDFEPFCGRPSPQAKSRAFFCEGSLGFWWLSPMTRIIGKLFHFPDGPGPSLPTQRLPHLLRLHHLYQGSSNRASPCPDYFEPISRRLSRETKSRASFLRGISSSCTRGRVFG